MSLHLFWNYYETPSSVFHADRRRASTALKETKSHRLTIAAERIYMIIVTARTISSVSDHYKCCSYRCLLGRWRRTMKILNKRMSGRAHLSLTFHSAIDKTAEIETHAILVVVCFWFLLNLQLSADDRSASSAIIYGHRTSNALHKWRKM